jgi:hypothetical protein
MFACFAVYVLATERGDSPWPVVAFFGIPAVLAFLLGRAVLYVLAGTTTPAKGTTTPATAGGKQTAAIPSKTEKTENPHAVETQTVMHTKLRCEAVTSPGTYLIQTRITPPNSPTTQPYGTNALCASIR